VLNSFSLPVTGGITAAASGIWSDGSIVHFYAVGNQLYQVFIANYSSTNIWIYNLNDVITSIMVDSQNQYVFLTMNQSLIVYMFPFNNPYSPQVYHYNKLLYDFFLDASCRQLKICCVLFLCRVYRMHLVDNSKFVVFYFYVVFIGCCFGCDESKYLHRSLQRIRLLIEHIFKPYLQFFKPQQQLPSPKCDLRFQFQ
jgi:hypothetical protein